MCVGSMYKQSEVLRGHHTYLTAESKKYMSYKWRTINTVLYFILKEEAVYKGCHGFAYFAEYFFVMGAPECAVESCYSIVKLLLSKSSTLNIEVMRIKLRILYFFRKDAKAN